MIFVLKKGASKKDIDLLTKKLNKRKGKGINAKKYWGVIKLKEDALDIQNQLRD